MLQINRWPEIASETMTLDLRRSWRFDTSIACLNHHKGTLLSGEETEKQAVTIEAANATTLVRMAWNTLECYVDIRTIRTDNVLLFFACETCIKAFESEIEEAKIFRTYSGIFVSTWDVKPQNLSGSGNIGW